MKFWQVYVKQLKIWLPKPLKEELDILIDDMVDSEMDIVLVLDGKEGTGKSKLARLIAAYIAFVTKTKFSVDNIHFTTNDYIKFSENSNKFTVNILDESRQALNKKRSISRSNVFFTNWLSENRDKQQVHILVLPAVHDLDTYISNWRMALLINCKQRHKVDDTARSGYRLDRGYVKVFEKNTELQRVLHNKNKYGYYAYPKYPKFWVKMKNQEPLSEEEYIAYKEKKAKIRKDKYSESEIKESKELMRIKKAAKRMIDDGKTKREVAKYFGYEPSILSKWDFTKIELET